MKLLAVFALLISSAPAASWDGTRGDLTLNTFSHTVRVGNFDQPQTTFKIKCANLAVSAVRITVTVHNGDFTSTESRIVTLNPQHFGIVTFPNTDESVISAAPVITEMFDGANIQF